MRVVFLPANRSNWRQPCDRGTIAALKKRYRYHLLRVVLKLYDYTPERKAELAAQVPDLGPGGAGVVHGRTTHIMDAANFLVQAWDAATDNTIKNCFVKANIGVDLGNLYTEEELDQAAEFGNIGIEELRAYEQCDVRDNI